MESERPEKRLKMEAGIEKDTGKTGVEKDEEILRLKNRVKELENLVEEEKSKNGENKNKVNFFVSWNMKLVLSCIDRVEMNCGTSWVKNLKKPVLPDLYLCIAFSHQELKE